VLAAACRAVIDAAPGPVGATEAFPTSTAAGWRSLTLSGLDGAGCFSPNLGCFIVHWAGKLVLCDAGIGPGPNAYLGGLRGDLLHQLAAMGIMPDDVAAVVFTHLHMDHIGWATRIADDGQRRWTFPKADYFVAKTELDFWTSGATGARVHHIDAFDAILRPLVSSGRLTAVAYDAPILAGMSLLATPGHTPGHASIVFGQGHEQLVVAGDIFHCPGQVERPEWHHRADMDPNLARITRRAFIAQAASQGWLVAAGHFRNGLQVGTIAPQGDGHRFVPVDAAMASKFAFVHQGRLQ